MAGISTGVSLLSGNVKYVHLSYSTGTLTSRFRAATASPNPDTMGNTGYPIGSNGSGIDITSSTFFIATEALASSYNYPNVPLYTSIHREYMGHYTGTLTPSFKDSSGIFGTTDGSFTADLTRDFCWGTTSKPMPTSLTRVTTSNTETCAIVFDTLDYIRFAYVDDYVITSPAVGGEYQWNTLLALSQDGGLYNEVKFENLSGDAAWVVTAAYNLSEPRSKNTFYNIQNSAIWCTNRVTAGSFVNGIRVTFRNKANPAVTFVQDITITVTRA